MALGRRFESCRPVSYSSKSTLIPNSRKTHAKVIFFKIIDITLGDSQVFGSALLMA